MAANKTSDSPPVTSPRRRLRPPWCPPSRIPRPVDLWLEGLLVRDKWVDTRHPDKWLSSLRRLAASHGCVLVCDRLRHWWESRYTSDYRDRGPTILAGGAGDHRCRCAAILHELGHHILWVKHRHPGDELQGEIAAWRVAQSLANEHRLPLPTVVRRRALRSYRYSELVDRHRGSKRRTRRRPLPGGWRIESSNRTTATIGKLRIFPRGKKGRRLVKKYIKRTTTRRERRSSRGLKCWH